MAGFTGKELASEVWKQVPEWPYEVSSLGRVRRQAGSERAPKARVLKPNGSLRYQQVTLCTTKGKWHPYIHQLVAEAFIGPRPPGHEVNHKDGRPGNNRVWNLEYLTPLQNKLHAAANGLVASGERHHQHRHPERRLRGSQCGAALLDEEKVTEIKRLIRRGYRLKDIGAHFGVNRTTISQIKRNATWKHVPWPE